MGKELQRSHIVPRQGLYNATTQKDNIETTFERRPERSLKWRSSTQVEARLPCQGGTFLAASD